VTGVRSAAALGAALALGLAASGQTSPSIQTPGRAGGETLLPNGWSLAPAGRHVAVGDFPLAMTLSPDGRYAVVANSGVTKPTLRVVDLETLTVRSTVPVADTWLGLAWAPKGDRLYASGASKNAVLEFRWREGALAAARTVALGEAVKEEFTGGIAVRPDGRRLYAVNPLGQTLTAVDLASRRVVASVHLPAEPYTVVASPDGKSLFVSLWGGSRVLRRDAETLAGEGSFSVGEHPSAMALSRDGRRLFVACANTNSVWILDLSSGSASEQVSVALYPGAPAGATPGALALSPDGRTLIVANADNNCVAVVDVSEAGSSRTEGFVPTGWYPTDVTFSRDGKRLLVLSGKGLVSYPNPRGPRSPRPLEQQYIGRLLTGSLSVVPWPDAQALSAYTEAVYRVTPYRDATKLAPARAPEGSPIPARVGDPSPIRYIFYVIRENRTYDQVFGDVAAGNGDPSLCLFGDDVTPNAHALARQFVLLDNFYVDAEVSYDGHSFATAAYATDAIEKMWPQNYGHRGGRYLTDAGGPWRNAYGNLTAPADGYIWDAAARAGVPVRSYGEFTRRTDSGGRGAARGPLREAAVPGLEGRVHPDYPGWDLSIPDARRVGIWLEEFRRFETDGNLPRLSVLWLPNDHTAGAKPGFPTPRAMVAENDMALGRLVEAISKSRYWKESAIFVLEDDAQNGPDHVDAHRSVALVASPWARHGAVDSTLYTTSGMLRTIELILGLPPMSQYDAAAAPMYGAFDREADPKPYAAVAPRVALDEKNPPGGADARASLRMDLDEADRAPDRELNEIVWRSVKGKDATMPPPVRAAFVRPREVGAD
jgi:DNA-binding beta-propeller fold protein YncE